MILFVFIIVTLFIIASLCKQKPYEKYLSDMQQECFIKKYHHKKRSDL